LFNNKSSGGRNSSLKNRENWVLTRDFNRLIDGFHGFSNWEEVKHKASELNLEELMIIGGAEIYKQSIQFADELIITHVNATFNEADVFFPEIDSAIWKEVETINQSETNENNWEYKFNTYIRSLV
jgi:dihydrofolate reductase